tara:strand:+ start:2727 stop:2888 length:162 start_codon:yes stop_codon:yes gene_type:complete
MSTDFYLVFLLFITACSYYSYKAGAANGRSQMVTDLIDRNLVTIKQLKKEYEL